MEGGEGSLGVGVVEGVAQRADDGFDAKAPLEFLEGGNNARMFAVTEEDLVARLPVESPEGNIAADGDIFRESEAVGGDLESDRHRTTQLASELGDVAVGLAGEGANFLDGFVGLLDGTEGAAGHGALATVVEILFVGEGRKLLAVAVQV